MFKHIFALAVFGLVAACSEAPGEPAGGRRIVATSGALTEIVYALGFGHEVVAVDSTARWPREVQDKPSIGYVRKLSAEGILSVEPTLVLTTSDAGPAAVFEHLAAAEVRIVDVPGSKGDRSLDALRTRIRAVARTLGAVAEGAELVATIDRDLDALSRVVEDRPRVRALFLFGANPMRLVAAGRGTGAQVLFELLGAENVCSDLEGFQPVGAESLIERAPEVVLVGQHRRSGSTGEVPGLEQTPAGQHGRVVEVDAITALAGGPRVVAAAREFAEALHPGKPLPPSASLALLDDAAHPRG